MRGAWAMAMAIFVATMPVTAQAGSKEVLQPVQLGNESVRFDRGEYVLDLPGRNAVVQIRSMPSDHGYLSFAVVVLNTGPQPFNIDIGNVRVEGTAKPVRLLSRAEMTQKAENRAFWARLGTALIATQRTNYYGTVSTPYGWSHVTVSGPCYSCQEAAAANMERIQGYLDETRRTLGDRMLQVTTVDPGRGYAGRIFLTRFDRKPMSQMRLIVSIEGEDFAFGFRFATAGTPMPSFRMIARAPAPEPASAPLLQAPPPQQVAEVRAAPVPQPIWSQPRVTPVPASAPAAAAPPPVFRPAVAMRTVSVNSDKRRKWQRYYQTLVDVGTSPKEAKSLADQEFGAID